MPLNTPPLGLLPKAAHLGCLEVSYATGLNSIIMERVDKIKKIIKTNTIVIFYNNKKIMIGSQ